MYRNNSQTVSVVKKTLDEPTPVQRVAKDFLAVAAACNKVIYKYIHVQCVGEFTVDVQPHDGVKPLRRHRCPQVVLYAPHNRK